MGSPYICLYSDSSLAHDVSSNISSNIYIRLRSSEQWHAQLLSRHNASPRLPKCPHPIHLNGTLLRVCAHDISHPIFPKDLNTDLDNLLYSAPPVSIDQIVSDFDGVTFHLSTPSSKSQILISLSVKCFRDLLKYGAESVLQREYGPYIVNPEAGYDFSILIDLDNLPPSPEERDELVRKVSLLKRNAMAAPFERAFDEFGQLAEEASRYTSESAPQGVAEGGQVMAIHYREEEAIYIKASHDRVTVIFSTIFRDETDRIFGKVFLQEFVDARRRAIQNAPQVLFRSDPPLELQGIPGLGKTGEKGEVGYITFGQFLPPFLLETSLHTSR